ncbi:MAG: arylesterase [Acidobacteriota bacterium]
MTQRRRCRVVARGALAGMLLAAALAGACGNRSDPNRPAAAGTPAPAAAPAPAATARVVVLGDSLTAGLGLSPDESYPTLLQARLRSSGLAVEIVNAGVSGDTSAGGLRRLDWSLEGPVQVLVVALGGNDGLRGLPPEELRRNLAAIIERAQSRQVTVILAGMEAPPNLGRIYTSAFRKVYRDLADQFHVALLPFLLDGVAGVGSLNQADGIHPNPDGARKVADNLWPLVEAAVRHALTP